VVERYLLSIYDKLPWLLFSVFRSEIQKEVYQAISNSHLDIRFGELAINVLGDIFGRTKYFPDEIDLCRDVTELNRLGFIKESESSSTRYPYLSEYINDGVIDQFYLPFASCIKQALKSRLTNLSNDEISDLVSVSRDIYTKNHYPAGRILYNLLHTYKFIWDLWCHVPRILKMSLLIITGYNDARRYLTPVPPQLCIVGDIIHLTAKLHSDDMSLVS
jgi:hypothetical protein